MRTAVVLAAATLLSMPAVSAGKAQHAAMNPVKFGDFVLDLGGELRLVGGRMTSIAVDTVSPAVPDEIPNEDFLTTRLRWHPSLSWYPGHPVIRKVAAVFEADVLDGSILAGNGRTPLAFSRKSRISRDVVDAGNVFHVGEAYLLVYSDYFAIKAGRQRSHWGLGMLANDGLHDPRDFGVLRFGDVVERLLVNIRPLRFATQEKWGQALSISVAGDYVYQDVFADRTRGDRAFQGLITVTGRMSFGELGAYYLYRWQENDLGDRTRAHIVDAFASFHLEGGGLKLELGAEWAGVFGDTEVPRNIAYPSGMDVKSSAMLMQVSLEHRYVRICVEAGRADGDQDPFDGSHNTFTMNPDHRVGLVLFPEYLKDMTAVTAYNMADPAYSGTPARGFMGVPTNGGVSNAIYAFPRITGTFVPHLDIVAGVLVAYSQVPLVDPFMSALAGGAAIGPRGGPASTDLGWEVDAAARTYWDLGHVKLTGVVEYGMFVPGDAFADAAGVKPDKVHLVQGRLHLNW